MAKINQDGNTIGRVGALAVIAAAVFGLTKVCGLGGMCPLSGSCHFEAKTAPADQK